MTNEISPKTESEILRSDSADDKAWPPGIYTIVPPSRLREATEYGGRVVATIQVPVPVPVNRQEFQPCGPGAYPNTMPVTLRGTAAGSETHFVIREDLDSVLAKLQAEASASAKRTKEALNNEKTAQAKLATETARANGSECLANQWQKSYLEEIERANRGEKELAKLRAAYKTLRSAVGEIEAKRLLGEVSESTS